MMTEREKDGGAQARVCLADAQSFRMPECPVCWDGFNDNAHMPRLLQCGHTICQACLDRLLFDAGVGRRCVRCPECRGLCMWHGLNELPKNYILLRILNPRSRKEYTGRKILTSLWQQATGVGLPNFAGSWLLTVVERKVREIAKLVWAVAAMLVLVPLSFIHVVLSWWTAFLGCAVFIGASVGGIGLAVFMFFAWCTLSVIAVLRLSIGWLFGSCPLIDHGVPESPGFARLEGSSPHSS